MFIHLEKGLHCRTILLHLFADGFRFICSESIMSFWLRKNYAFLKVFGFKDRSFENKVYKSKNMLLLKNPQFLPNHNETLPK